MDDTVDLLIGGIFRVNLRHVRRLTDNPFQDRVVLFGFCRHYNQSHILRSDFAGIF